MVTCCATAAGVCQALTDAVLRGSMGQVKRLWIDKPDDHPTLLAACSAHGININGRGANGQADTFP